MRLRNYENRYEVAEEPMGCAHWAEMLNFVAQRFTQKRNILFYMNRSAKIGFYVYIHLYKIF